MEYFISSFILVFFLLILQTTTAQCPCKDSSLCTPIQNTPDKEVLGFMTRPTNWPKYNWTELTTIAIFSEINDTELGKLMCYAHAHQVRVVVHTGSEIIKLTDPSTRTEYISKLLNRVQMYHLDGVNIDAEDPIKSDSIEQKTLSQVTQEIYTTFKKQSPHYQISFDVAWSPKCIDGRCYDYKELAKWTDFLIVMAYDERSQVFESGPCLAGANSDYVKTDTGIKDYINMGITHDKLVLGLPWYGYDYPCVLVSNDESPCQIPRYTFRGVNCSDGAGRQLGYSDIINKFLPMSTKGKLLYNETTESVFFTYTINNTYRQIWFDGPSSLSVKYKYAATMKLRGIGFWNTDTLDYYSEDSNVLEQIKEMWNAIKSFLYND